MGRSPSLNLNSVSLIKRARRTSPATGRRSVITALLSALLSTAPGCILNAPTVTGTSSASTTTTATASPLPTVYAGGPRAIRIIFKQTYPAGSFDASPGNGTVAKPGSGQPATRYFNPDGSILAGGGPTSGFWLSSFEIGISGATNASAPNPDCARFASAGEAAANANCNFGPNGPVGCGAPNGLYRVSEFDCLKTQTTADGTGGPNDGVYLRATFNRALLGTGENLMVAVEYAASAFSPAPSNPLTCFNNSTGAPAPEQCSDVTWKAYIKHSLSEMVQPFLMLVPPSLNYVNTGLGTSGVSSQMKQFIIPLSGDPQLSVLQISRIHSNLDTGASAAACNATGSLPANSPLCAGLVLYSLTLFRI